MRKTIEPQPRFVAMVGPDTRMDEGANPLPIKCPHCTMPDLDYVPETYLLSRGFTAPAETAPAELGNFLVRERVRGILEQVIPGACLFVRTAERKSRKPTPWWLAVPQHVVNMPGLPHRSKDRQSCKKCGAPKLGYHPYQPVKGDPKKYRHIGLEKCDCRGLDVFKPTYWSAVDTVENQYAQAIKYTAKGEEPPQWASFAARSGVTEPPPHAQRWTRIHLDRDLFFSVRLEQLLKKAKVKGQLVRSWNFRDVEPSAEDAAWIEEKLKLLGGSKSKNVKASARKVRRSDSALQWLQQYIAKQAKRKRTGTADFAAIEKKQKVTLPQDYQKFIGELGSTSFENVMDIDGFTAHLVPPSKLDFKAYRRAKWKKLGVTSDVDGVAFAHTDHGDVFVFDVAAQAGDGCPVYWYDHEQNALEPFATSFAACIRRFVEQS